MFSKLKSHAFAAGFHGSTSSNSASGSNPGSLHNLPSATMGQPGVAGQLGQPGQPGAAGTMQAAGLGQQPQYQSAGQLCFHPMPAGLGSAGSGYLGQPRNGSPAPFPGQPYAANALLGSGGQLNQPPAAAAASAPMLSNNITQHFEIGSLIGSAGPELAWRIYSAVRKCDRMPGESVGLCRYGCSPAAACR